MTRQKSLLSTFKGGGGGEGGIRCFYVFMKKHQQEQNTNAFAHLTDHKSYFTNIGETIIIKRTKQMGVNRLNSVQKATNLKKKIKSGNK